MFFCRCEACGASLLRPVPSGDVCARFASEKCARRTRPSALVGILLTQYATLLQLASLELSAQAIGTEAVQRKVRSANDDLAELKQKVRRAETFFGAAGE